MYLGLIETVQYGKNWKLHGGKIKSGLLNKSVQQMSFVYDKLDSVVPI